MNNREIKLRAWDITKKSFIYDQMITLDGQVCYFTGFRIEYPHGIILSQYTGIEDKGGIAIFEGDVIEARFHSWVKKHKRKAKVEFYLGRFCAFYEKFNLLEGKDIEVIGNIFENPELIK